MNSVTRGRRRALAIVLAGAVVGGVAGCGGGGGDPPPPPPPQQLYGAAAYSTNDNCQSVGVIGTQYSSATAAEGAVRARCNSDSQTLAAQSGATPDSCKAIAFDNCAAIAAGINDNRPNQCVSIGERGSSTSAAGSAALRECRNRLGPTGRCQTIASACATGSASSGIYRPSGGGTQPPDDGVDRSQVGDEFGTRSTTGRSFALTCTDDVYFEHAGNVVLPSVDIVGLPSEAGTVTLEYDAFRIPDRFVVQMGGQIRIDTQYVGTSNSVAEVNAVLDHYGFQRTTQSSIISPGNGRRSFQKPAGSTSAIVRIYAPLEGTAWEVTLKFQSNACPGNGGPPTNGADGVVLGNIVDGCNDGYDIDFRFFEYDVWRNGSTIAGESLAGVWPDSSQVWTTSGFETRSSDLRLSCTAGKGVCYGAERRGANDNFSWGSGIDGDQDCTSCCVQCPSTGTADLKLRLTCN